MTTPHSIPTTQADASASLTPPEALSAKGDHAAPPFIPDALHKGPCGVYAARDARGGADGAPPPLQTITNDATDPRFGHGISIAAGAHAAEIGYIETADARSDASGACQLLLSAADLRGSSRGASALLVAAPSVGGGGGGLEAKLFSGSFDDAASLCPPFQLGRLATRATSERGDVDADYQSAVAAAYAPREWPSRAGTGSTYPTDWRRWGFYKVDKQVDEDIDRLEDIDIGGQSAVKVGVGVANRVGELFFTHFKPMMPQKVTTRTGRAAALTVVAINKLANKAMRVDLDGYERTTEEGAHVEVLREIKVELEKLGAVAGPDGTVEGPLKPFACAHTYHGFTGTGPANDTKVTAIGSLLRKFFIIGSVRGELSEIVEDGVDCSFGKRTLAHKKRKGLASAAAGNFRSNAQDGVPLPPELAGPRDLRFGIKEYLENGQLDEGTFCMIGKTGELLKAAAARGEEKLFIFDTSGFVASECQVSNVVKSSKKPIRDVARREASWAATLELCKEKEPVLYHLYYALDKLGMMKAPTARRSEYDCLRGAWYVVDLWRAARSPLADSFVVVFGDGPKLLTSMDAFEKIQQWDAGAPYARTLLDHAGVETLSELVHVTGDSSTGVKVPGSRAFEGGYHLVPKDQAMDDGHGGHVRKRRKIRAGTGNGPVEFTCHFSGCAHKWRPETFVKSGRYEGYATCKCRRYVAPPG